MKTDSLRERNDITGVFDTHSHYDDSAFDGVREELLSNLFSDGLEGLITCGCDLESTERCRVLSEKYEKIYYSAGFHPENLEGYGISDIGKLTEFFNDKKCVALGEIGLDYYYDIDKPTQKQWFIKQLELAKECDKPVIIHCREAYGDTLETIKEYRPKGVFHCFSGSLEYAEEVLKLGMKLGIGGVVAFKNAKSLVNVVSNLSVENFVLETDCPYLAPEPFRGNVNHSGLIYYIVRKVSELSGLTDEEVKKITYNNVKELFFK